MSLNFYIYGPLVKKAMFRFLKQALFIYTFIELSPRLPEYPEGHLKDNVWIFCLIKVLIHNLSKI